jgi:hypothetical protein
VNKPGSEVQDSVFAAAVAAGPAVAPIPESWLKGYTRVHCNPAGAVPPPPKKVTSRLPGPPVPWDRVRKEPCANAGPQRQKRPKALARQTRKLIIGGADIKGYYRQNYSFFRFNTKPLSRYRICGSTLKIASGHSLATGFGYRSAVAYH